MKADIPGAYSCLVDVAVLFHVYTTYTYGVPWETASTVTIGKRVLVPFGKRRLTGYIVSLNAQVPPDRDVKPVAQVLDPDPLFPETMVPFFRWVARYYLYPLGGVIQTALPGGLTVNEQIQYHLTEAGRQVLASGQLDTKIRACLQRLAQGPCRFKQLCQASSGQLSRSVLNSALSKGWLARQTVIGGGRTRPKIERFVALGDPVDPGTRLSAVRQRIITLLRNQGTTALAVLKQEIPTAGALVRSMARDGQVRLKERRVYRDPLGETIAPDSPPILMPEQQHAVERMRQEFGRGYRTFLLAGVTGSGKTEVYLHMAAEALERSLPVLVLVPEIALVSQIERAFRARFGECVALLHSGLSTGERLDQWRRIQQGEARIAVGARSAVFAPFGRLGLIIVDEEHDDSYKQEGALRYNARDLAVVRGQQNDALVILGSATPSIQSTYNAETGKFERIQLFERIDNRTLPDVRVHDLGELKEERGVRRFLTPGLMAAIRETLDRKEQVLLFLNRRGFSSISLCADCRQPLRCERCEISLTYHQRHNAYKCHYCGYSRAAVSACSACGSRRIYRLGMGTEQLEQALKGFFPEARVARMDRDTINRKGAVIKILKALRQRNIDILVGTQMVAKGHDYPHITLVGIICADLSLNLPDFRAGERTFQLLAQVAGRAGRGKQPGRVILQTLNPDHFSIQCARNQDADAFYRQEIQFRKGLQYPPFTRLIQVRVQSADKSQAGEAAHELGRRAQSIKSGNPQYAGVFILGPIEAPLARIANQYRWQLLLKSAHTGPLHRFAGELAFDNGAAAGKRGVSISLDVDPLFLM